MQTRATVTGILRDESGRPVHDAIVMIVGGSNEFNDIASVSNNKGEFRLANVVVPGHYVLQIQNNGEQIRKDVNILDKDTVFTITF